MNNFTIKQRLVFTVGILSLLLIIIGLAGIYGIGTVNSSVKTIYEDRLIAADQLDTVIRNIQANQLEIGQAIASDPSQLSAHITQIEKNKGEATKTWAAYMATYLTDDEKLLATQFETRRASFIDKALTPILDALKAQNISGASALYTKTLPPLFEDVRQTMDALFRLQIDAGKKEYENSQSTYSTLKILCISSIILGLMIAAGMGIWLIKSITVPMAEAIKIANAIAEGDLTQHIVVKSRDETGQLLQALKDMNDSLTNIVGQVRSGTDTIASATTEIAAGNMDLSSRTESQASSLEETASSMEELTATVKQNGENARQANQLAASASDVAVKGGAVVSQVVVTMGSINDSSRKIVDIIGVIDGIAFQTNILALNAAVEAARAGEQGRGFAVVAAEVRNLAQRSASAAKEIKALIDDSVSKVDAGSNLVNQAGSTMDELVASVQRVTDIMGEITSASLEQEVGIEQINQAVTEMDNVTQQNAALVEQAAAAAQSLQEQAANLTEVVSVFKVAGGFAIPKASAPIKRAPIKVVKAKSVVKKAPKLKMASNENQRTHKEPSSSSDADWEEF